MVALGVAKTDGAYVVLNAAGDGLFQFLPLILAITAAKRFKMNQFTALAIGFALVYPNIAASFTAEKPLYTLFAGTPIESPIFSTFFGLPIIFPASSYLSTVLPVIAAVWAGAKIEKGFKKNHSRCCQSLYRTILYSFDYSATGLSGYRSGHELGI